MRKAIKIVIGLAVVGGLGYAGWTLARQDRGDEGGLKRVKVVRGTIVDKALATGQVVPDQEVQVKSQLSGIVKRTFVEVGDQVAAGDRLFEITPDPTPLELAEVERSVELTEVAFAKAEADLARVERLWEQGIRPREAYDVAREAFDRTRVERDRAKEKLALTRDGRVARKGGADVDSVIRAPTAGTVLERLVDPGDPVVPLTTFQEGTPLLSLADMGGLVFKGTVDEIDVGKLAEGLPVRIKIGALPEAQVTGKLTRIAPKAKEKEGSTLFDVEAEIVDRGGVFLRAGYSANAEIVIREKQDVLLLPERLVTFEGEKAFVETPPADPKAEPEKKAIQVGLSDGLQVEVVEGLGEGDEVIERPPKEIS